MNVARAYYELDHLKEEGWSPVKPSPSIRGMEEDQDISNSIKVSLKKFTTENNILYSIKPVMIEILLDDGIFYASNENLNIDAEGNSIPSAIQDFSRHINYFYSYYSKKDTTEVMGNAVRLKDLYESHFSLNANK